MLQRSPDLLLQDLRGPTSKEREERTDGKKGLGREGRRMEREGRG